MVGGLRGPPDQLKHLQLICESVQGRTATRASHQSVRLLKRSNKHQLSDATTGPIAEVMVELSSEGFLKILPAPKTEHYINTESPQNQSLRSKTGSRS